MKKIRETKRQSRAKSDKNNLEGLYDRVELNLTKVIKEALRKKANLVWISLPKACV